MSERLRNKPSVLVLADFSDGSWHAASFAIQFLYNEKSPISILQTYQNPNWGHFMMRKPSYQLKKITRHELAALKNKLLANYKINKHEIKTVSKEGELNSILKCIPILKGPHNVVLCTYSSFEDSCTRQNKCLEKIINTTNNPLFILPKTFEADTSKKLLLVGNPDKISSGQLSDQVIEICKKTQSNLEVLFVLKNQYQKINEDVQSYYNKHFKGVELTINNIQNKSKCKGINNYLKNSSRDLIVIEND